MKKVNQLMQIIVGTKDFKFIFCKNISTFFVMYKYNDNILDN